MAYKALPEVEIQQPSALGMSMPVLLAKAEDDGGEDDDMEEDSAATA